MLEVRNLSYHTKNFSLKNISFTVGEKEYVVLLGPTGSGKTLLLKNIAGIVHQNFSGEIKWRGEDVSYLLPEERSFVYMAQDYKLFPHLDVSRNIMFSPAWKKLEPSRKSILFNNIVSTFGISHLLERPIDNLSGGERQRVALARALASSPKLLLLDEPFSAIDTGLKRHLWFEIKNILLSSGISVIQVTHDIEEAMTVADRIYVIINGTIVQSGLPEEILLRPSTLDVAKYLGIKNLYEGEVLSVVKNEGGKTKLEVGCSGVRIVVTVEDGLFSIGDKVVVCVRPQIVKIIRENESVRQELSENLFVGGEIVKAFFYSGESSSVFIKYGGIIFEARFPQAIYKRYNLSVGKKITFALWWPDIIVYRK